uniref:Endonuclease/exonuclease/phosphatase domain-containing protein n=1 Tax=Bos indicus x Bos taurus TaxID=30522 RepID=A0A4W2DVZ2_BOBOX
MKLSHARGATQDRRVMVERSDRMWSTGEGNGKPLQYSCLENPMNSMKRQNDGILKEKLPRSVGAQYATGDQWRNNSRKNEGMEPKQKQYPAVDVTGDRSKVQCCKEQYCIGTWNVRSMNQGKLEVVKQEMARVNVDILGISELKWTGMGEFNSDDHYIYYCGQESLRRNGVAIMVNKRVHNTVLGCNLKDDRMISVHFQGKPFNITVIQVYAPTSNAKAEVEWFYEDLQDLLELTPQKDVLFIIGDWNAKVGSQETPGVTGKFGLGIQNEAGQRLIRVLPRKCTGYSKHPLPTTQEKTLHMDITRWSTPKSDYVLRSQRWKSSTQSIKTRPGADCGSDHELLITKFRLKLKKVGKTTRPFRYDLNQIPYDYTVEVRNRFKGLDLIDRLPDELVQETGIKTILMEKKCKKAKWLSGEALQIAVKTREAKSKRKGKI